VSQLDCKWKLECFFYVVDPEKCKEIGKIGDILYGGSRTKKNLEKMTKKGSQKFRNFPKKM